VAEQLTVPLIPPTGRMAGRGGGRGRPVPAPLPLSVPPDSPAPPSELVYGMGRIDASGRIGDSQVMRALGWQAGERLTITAVNGVVLARRDPAGLHVIADSTHLTIPSVLRRRYGLAPGTRVLLAGHPDAQVLAACAMAVVDQVIRAQMSLPAGEGDAR
jgi:bifunctional DNA-binding transcriptional regulator/antitoxin component of YhaV-PrlF toxin-antitoxin module